MLGLKRLYSNLVRLTRQLLGDAQVIEEVGDEIDLELRTHFEIRKEALQQTGHSAEQAARETELRFGDLLTLRKECLRETGVIRRLNTYRLMLLATAFLSGLVLAVIAWPKGAPQLDLPLLSLVPATIVAPEERPQTGITHAPHCVEVVQPWAPHAQLHFPPEPAQSVVALVDDQAELPTKPNRIVWKEYQSKSLSADMHGKRYRVLTRSGSALQQPARPIFGRVDFADSIIAIEGLKLTPETRKQLHFATGFVQANQHLWLRLLPSQKGIMFVVDNGPSQSFEVITSTGVAVETVVELEQWHALEPAEQFRQACLIYSSRNGPLRQKLSKYIFDQVAAPDSSMLQWSDKQRDMLHYFALRDQMYRALMGRDYPEAVRVCEVIEPIATRWRDEFPEVSYVCWTSKMEALARQGKSKAAAEVGKQFLDMESPLMAGLPVSDLMKRLAAIQAMLRNPSEESRLIDAAIARAKHYGRYEMVLSLVVDNAMSFNAVEDYESADELLSKYSDICERYPNGEPAHLFRCQKMIAEVGARKSQSRITEAWELVRNENSLLSRTARLNYLAALAHCADLNCDHPMAIEIYRQRIALLDGGSFQYNIAQFRLAFYLCRDNRYKDAVPILTGLEGSFGDSVAMEFERRQLLGRAYRGLGNHKAAVQMLESALNIKPHVKKTDLAEDER